MLASLALLTIQLGTALYFERFLASGWFELFVIFIGLLCAVCIWYGEYLREQWAYPSGAVFYFIAGVNLTFLVVAVQCYLAYLFGLFFAIVGFMRSVALSSNDEDWLNEYYPESNLETYSTTQREQVVDPDPVYVNFAREELSKPKRTRKKATKKKTTRKKTKKKRKR
ncbi:MAG: hypothetical protein ACE5FT_00505 [Candidatus Nanoarchaeia archaeon]